MITEMRLRFAILGQQLKAQEETKVGFNPLSRKCPERNICIHDCHKADGSKSRYECMQECPKSLCVEAVRAETKKEQNVGTKLEDEKSAITKSQHCSTEAFGRNTIKILTLTSKQLAQAFSLPTSKFFKHLLFLIQWAS
eukprot:UN00010